MRLTKKNPKTEQQTPVVNEEPFKTDLKKLKLLVTVVNRKKTEFYLDYLTGFEVNFQTAVAGADRAFVVTTPDMVCARDAQIVAHLLEERNIPARLVINRLRPDPICRGKMPDLDEIIDIAGLQLIGVLPEDEAVAVANAYGKPLPVESNAAECFKNIAARFLGEDVPLANLKKMKA